MKRVSIIVLAVAFIAVLSTSVLAAKWTEICYPGGPNWPSCKKGGADAIMVYDGFEILEPSTIEADPNNFLGWIVYPTINVDQFDESCNWLDPWFKLTKIVDETEIVDNVCEGGYPLAWIIYRVKNNTANWANATSYYYLYDAKTNEEVLSPAGLAALNPSYPTGKSEFGINGGASELFTLPLYIPAGKDFGSYKVEILVDQMNNDESLETYIENNSKSFIITYKKHEETAGVVPELPIWIAPVFALAVLAIVLAKRS